MYQLSCINFTLTPVFSVMLNMSILHFYASIMFQSVFQSLVVMLKWWLFHLIMLEVYSPKKIALGWVRKSSWWTGRAEQAKKRSKNDWDHGAGLNSKLHTSLHHWTTVDSTVPILFIVLVVCSIYTYILRSKQFMHIK